MSKPHTTVVYLIAARDLEMVKIGLATNVRDRLSQLQTGSPCALELLATIPGGENEERALHWLFGHLHVRGEWFCDPDASIAAWFDERCRLIARVEHATAGTAADKVLRVGGVESAVSVQANVKGRAAGNAPGRKTVIDKHYPKIKQLHGRGLSMRAIEKRLGLSRTAVRKAYRAQGLMPNLANGASRAASSARAAATHLH